jgi:hypothetical protein
MQNTYAYDWNALKDFVQRLLTNAEILLTLRLMSMHARMKGFFTKYETKLMLSRFRSRNRDEWDEEKKEMLAKNERLRVWGERDHNNRVPEYDLTNQFMPLDIQVNQSMKKVLRNTALLTSSYSSTQPAQHGHGQRRTVDFSDVWYVKHNVACKISSGQVQMYGHNLGSMKLNHEQSGVSRRPQNMLEHTRKVWEHRKWVRKLKSRQREVYEVFQRYIRNPNESTRPPSITWVNGCAGTGKSELIRRILVYTELKQRPTVRTAFNSINALQIRGHRTSSLLHFSGKDVEAFYPLMYANFKEFKSLVEVADLILINEFSNQAPWHLAKFSVECQRATGNYDQPFGGIPVIMGGDLGQMGPVKAGKSIAECIADMCMNIWTAPENRSQQPL